MEVIILPTAEAVDRVAAEAIATTVAAEPAAVIGLATGSSPVGVYAELRRRVRIGETSFSRAHGFALDEYVGLSREHPQSYASVIARDVTEPLGFDPSNVHVPDGEADDPTAAAAAFETAIREAGGIDVQILGIGSNGHIGFNEPTSSLSSRTRLTTLAPSTRADNARFFEHVDQVPTHCITQGLGTILDARRVLLVAHGRAKSSAIAAAIEGPLTAFVPASALQLHPHATLIIDEAAAAGLQLADYYRSAAASRGSTRS